MAEMTLWGFDASTYVRTVKMVLAEKGVTDFSQVPLNVLAGEPKSPEHLARHPFGKVPVLEHDGLRILETSAIVRYLNDVLGSMKTPQVAIEMQNSASAGVIRPVGNTDSTHVIMPMHVAR